MTNAEALEKIDIIRSWLNDSELKEALDMAKAALFGKDTDVLSNDTIYRQAAIDAINNIMPTKEGFYEPSEVLCELMQLPSAQPEIIMCKDCKYYTSVTAQCEIRGKGLYLIRGLDDFCSRAERRTENVDADT